MTLSDYERRVLQEIESELTRSRRRFWSRLWGTLRGALRRTRWLALVVALGAAVITVAAVLLPDGFSAGASAAVGIGVGFAVRDLWTRRPRRSR